MSVIHALDTDGTHARPMRWRHRLWVFAGALLATLFLLYTGKAHAQGAPAPAERLEGTVTVVDGDTLQFADRTVRLWGVDAPAAQQICQLDGKPWACGDAAREALAGYVQNHQVRCELVGEGEAARCRVGRHELNGWLVQQGWALDPPTEDRAREYTRLQNDAALARRGLWQGQFIEPWAWRVREPEATE